MLHDAADELRFLLGKGYRKDYALKFVANHHKLKKSERATLARAVFSYREASAIKRKAFTIEEAAGMDVVVDGFNVLITCEAVLAGRALVCDDGVVRDTEGVFGKYRIKPETWKTLDRVCHILKETKSHFLFDAQVSRSGKLVEYLKMKGYDARTEKHVDATIVSLNMVVATSDSVILGKVRFFVDVPRQMFLER
jgi:hypothetical protein